MLTYIWINDLLFKSSWYNDRHLWILCLDIYELIYQYFKFGMMIDTCEWYILSLEKPVFL